MRAAEGLNAGAAQPMFAVDGGDRLLDMAAKALFGLFGLFFVFSEIRETFKRRDYSADPGESDHKEGDALAKLKAENPQHPIFQPTDYRFDNAGEPVIPDRRGKGVADGDDS